MRTPDEAIAEILRRMRAPRIDADVRLEHARGRVLARDVVSDTDLPPFEKSAMDGFAVHASDFDGAAERTLALAGEARAGTPFRGAVAAGECIAIYTGAELPPSCDAVVMVEKTRRSGTDARGRATIALSGGATRGQNVCHRGEDLARGARVLARGRRLGAIDLSVLAAVGCQPVPVFAAPRVALLTTGDELVPADVAPGPGQIREGNTFYLAARAAAEHARVTNFGIVPDDESVLEREFARALETSDAVITTGGVSMGKYDVVGAVFERLGVEPVFHKVAIKPGKPLWFGMRGAVPVFALPGNPVSCLIGFEVFVRPALAKLEGADEAELAPRLRTGRWLGPPPKPNERQQHLPCRVRGGADGVDELEPLAWKSSADITGLTRAQGLAVVEAQAELRTGELVRYRPLEGGA